MASALTAQEATGVRVISASRRQLMEKLA